MPNICLIASRVSGCAEILVSVRDGPHGLAVPAETSGGRQLLILQDYICANFNRFIEISDGIDAVSASGHTIEGLRVIGMLLNAYDGLVDDETKCLTVFSSFSGISFGVGSERFSERLRNTIRRNVGGSARWQPCGMRVVPGEIGSRLH
jgi:hypothetical protein